MRFTRSTQWVLVVVATLLTIASGQISSVVRQPPSQQYSSPQQQQQAARQQKYSGNINLVSDSVTNLAQRIARAISNQKSKTEIFSPVSIAGALSLLLLGSGGQTQKELLKVMGLDTGALSFQDIHLGFGRLFQDLVSNEPSLEPLVTWRQNDKCNRFDEEEDDEDYPLPPAANSANESSHDQHKISLANGIFLQDQYNLSQWYRKASMDLYQSEVRSLDFDDDPVGSTNTVNQWVSEKTHGKIPNILATALPSTTTLVLASAMYFRATWHKTFIEGATKLREFFPDGYDQPPIMVDMMGHGGCFPSYDSPELDARILGIPYKRRLSTMYVIMPNNSTRAKLLDLMAKLNSENISQMINNMTIKTTILLFPKMHIGNTLNLKRVLAMLGVRSLFTPDRSNLTAMVSEPPSDSELFFNRLQDVTSMPGWEGRPTVNIPPYVSSSSPKHDLTQGLTFSRVQPNEPDTDLASDDVTGTQPVTTSLPETREQVRPKRDVSYKAPSSKRGQSGPLRSKDFILNKRIVKEKGPVGKKGLRRRMKRATTEAAKALYVSSAIHQVDLDINEMGTEGGAATVITLNRSGSSVVFRANAPFLLLIRNDRTGLPLFYGAVFDPTG
ncbi:serine protease inhibitor 28Dc-like isoform X1 [Anopheles cruzii]|uniref:serine protease inhibitor 28Dc-like isoform X1 n=1 Tax=Anopheles cruzii TaxID=68878 RepID=UPI0022EC8855|nr:serine protease inhibitor 28Dc-like isoform X1 [Anopheles cruzii]